MEQETTVRQRRRMPAGENGNRIFFPQERFLEQVATATVTAMATHWTEQQQQQQQQQRHAVVPQPSSMDAPPTSSYMEEVRYHEEGFVGLIPLAWRIIKLLCIGMVLLVSSLTMYGVFYVGFMPGQSISRSLYFDYTGDSVVRHRKTMEIPYLTIYNSDETGVLQQQQQQKEEEVEEDDKEGSNHAEDEQPTTTTTSTTTTTTTCKDDDTAVTNQMDHAITTRKTSTEKEDNSNHHNNHHNSNNPWASIDLFSKHTPWQAVKPEVLPQPILQDRFLQPLQPYFVEVLLILPESQINQQNGMFGVSVELWSGNQTHLATAVRSARLPHESTWVGVVRKICWIIPLILGFTDESRVVIVQAFRHFVESSQTPLRHVIVQIIRQSSATIDQHVEVIGGELRIGKEMNLFQEFLRHYFYTCAFLGTSFFFSLHVLACCLFSMLWNANRDNRVDEPPCDLDENDLDDFHLHGDDGSYVSIVSNNHHSNANHQPTTTTDNDGIHVVGSSPEDTYDDNDSAGEWEFITASEEQETHDDHIPPSPAPKKRENDDSGPSRSSESEKDTLVRKNSVGVASMPKRQELLPRESKGVKSQKSVPESVSLAQSKRDRPHSSMEQQDINFGVGNNNLVPVTIPNDEESNCQQLDISSPSSSVRRSLGSEACSIGSQWTSPVVSTSPSMSFRLNYTNQLNI